VKRFLLFAGRAYYPAGGANDFVKSFESMETIIQYLQDEEDKPKEWDEEVEWANVLDTATGTRYNIDLSDYEFYEMEE